MGLDLPKCKAKSSLCEEDQKKDSHKRTIIKTKLPKQCYIWLAARLLTNTGKTFYSQSFSHGVRAVREDSPAEVAHSGLASWL